MNEEKKFARNLVDFIDESPSPFHVVKNVKDLLEKKGFEELDIRARWNIKKSGKYFVKRNNSTIVAFIIGDGDIEQEGFRIIGAHTDSPTLKIKPAPEMIVEKNYVKLNIEVYGSPILNSWLDRPLSMAGRVSFKSKNPIYPEEKLLNVHKPVLIIPNLAIHFNRKVNQGKELNQQKDIIPLLETVKDGIEKDNYFVNLIAEQLSVDKEQINNFEINLSEYERGSIVGLNDHFISSGKLDDLAMVHAGIHALMNSGAGKSTNVMVCFDNEEPGSKTKQGADSPMLRSILKRILFGLGMECTHQTRQIKSWLSRL
jgi:aspartyl aminopeptidase